MQARRAAAPARSYQRAYQHAYTSALVPIQVGAEIVKRALSYPLRLIASNAGVNGSVCQQRVLENLDANIGYNAATDVYEDLMAAGIIDPTKVGFPSCLHPCPASSLCLRQPGCGHYIHHRRAQHTAAGRSVGLFAGCPICWSPCSACSSCPLQ